MTHPYDEYRIVFDAFQHSPPAPAPWVHVANDRIVYSSKEEAEKRAAEMREHAYLYRNVEVQVRHCYTPTPWETIID